MGVDIDLLVECRGPTPAEVTAALLLLGGNDSDVIGGLSAIRPLLHLIAEYSEETDWYLCCVYDPFRYEPSGSRQQLRTRYEALPDLPPHIATTRCEVWDRRKYTIFGPLAGMRGVAPPIIDPLRGLPTNMSKRLQFIQTNRLWSGVWSTSWLTLKEIDPSLNPQYWQRTLYEEDSDDDAADGEKDRAVAAPSASTATASATATTAAAVPAARRRLRRRTMYDEAFGDGDPSGFLVWLQHLREYAERYRITSDRIRLVYGFDQDG